MTPLPYKVRATRDVYPQGFAEKFLARDDPWMMVKGEVFDALQNQYGAVVAKVGARTIGLKPDEYEMVDVARDSFWAWWDLWPRRIDEMLGCATAEIAARHFGLSVPHEHGGIDEHGQGLTIRVRAADRSVHAWTVFVRRDWRVSSITPTEP